MKMPSLLPVLAALAASDVDAIAYDSVVVINEIMFCPPGTASAEEE